MMLTLVMSSSGLVVRPPSSGSLVPSLSLRVGRRTPGDVTVGGPDVTVGEHRVTVGGPDVTVGGPDVTVGGPGVTLGEHRVTVGGPDVTVGVGGASRSSATPSTFRQDGRSGPRRRLEREVPRHSRGRPASGDEPSGRGARLMADLVYVLITVAFFATVAVVARRGIGRGEGR
jgi:hypothetical protein